MTQNDLGWPEVRIVQCWSCGISGTVYTFLQLFYNFFYTLFTSFSYPFYTIFTPLLNPVCTFLHHFYNLLPNPKSHHFFSAIRSLKHYFTVNGGKSHEKQCKEAKRPFSHHFHTLFITFLHPFYTLVEPCWQPSYTIFTIFIQIRNHTIFFPQSEVWSTILQQMAQNRMRNSVEKLKNQKSTISSEIRRRQAVPKGPKRSQNPKKSQKKFQKVKKIQKKNPKKSKKIRKNGNHFLR